MIYLVFDLSSVLLIISLNSVWDVITFFGLENLKTGAEFVMGTETLVQESTHLTQKFFTNMVTISLHSIFINYHREQQPIRMQY